ncbi:hypothetical protein CEUSTIGMA_g3859.t1 [Chlamydomonas eustigma]|uniref:tRNA(Phe) (4-demethylwyosine(37)-C(7)) aminocarboxypropyltransferase n=1 Tax=Chlamydomonas eustigma TaxID=1157962 RepID=A0A250WZZ3_9CHLO|nr:hypothetical protein CEUSTIGMA_g3859.t1 [Chlamydomonas eustigma]|eukprot:GAX76414.1 hypothetical protein CEUSTIGMA_g3859.t1 [Chlamydomonas eustigma]
MDELLEDLPVKWERLGDLALLPEGCLVHPAWSSILPDLGGLWTVMAKALGVRRLAKQAKVANTGTRDSQAIMLLGSDGWVEHKEGGVTFCLDVTKCMFSSGNVTERMRIGKLKCSGETVVDLYTGIGYYTIPILACAGADKVYACEWNTNAVTALHRNLRANHIPPDRCVVLQGDCRLKAPQSVADRVLLGLLPSSQGGWQTAVLALKPTGGWLHVHENVLDKAEGEWVETAVQRIQSLTRAIQGRQHWVASVRHVEHVKWYAPHIRHIVVDMELRPSPSVSAVLPSTAEAQECTSSRWISTGAVSANDASFNGYLRGLHEDGSRTSVSKRGTSERTGAAAAEAVTGPESSYWFRSPLTELPRVKEVVVPSAESSIETHQLLWQWFDLQVSRQREPVLLKGLDLGPAVQKWTPEYLADLPSSSTTQVSVHVTHESSGCLDFVNKNFSFKNMTLKELVQAVNKADVSSKADSNSDQLGSHNRDSKPGGSAASASASQTAASQNTTCTKYYLRSVGVNPRKEPAHLHASFPDLAQDIQLPVSLLPPDMTLFSSVLRVGSPGLRLWTHYDVMDTVLMQIRGTKQVLLWPPSDYDNLYMEGSSSPIIGVLDPDLIKYRRYSSAKPVLCTLTPGTALFIPSLWLHNVFSEPGSGASISVNAFWRHLPVEFYEKKDLYGNRDLVQANQADEEVGKVCNLLKELPGHYRAFYAQRLITRLTQQLLKDT